MKNIILILLPCLMLSCSKEDLVSKMPFELRFVLHDEEGSLITKDVSVTYFEEGKEKVIERLDLTVWTPTYPGDTFATHWKSGYMSVFASKGNIKDFYLKYNGYVDTLTLLYKQEGDMDYHSFSINGEEIKRDMSKLWPHNYITINKK